MPKQRVEFGCKWFDVVVQDDKYFIVKEPKEINGAVVVGVRRFDGVLHVAMVEQYRPAIGESSLELPRGRIEDGQDPVDAGLRELNEETGYTAKPESAQIIGKLHTNNSLLASAVMIVFAEISDTPQGELDGEVQVVSYYKPEELFGLLGTKITDSHTIAGLTFARQRGLL
ncbi:ADP-ribose pyrophosphatase [Pseudomonas nitritireducens]|uniref:GDP-mannose pyrophosphatase n=1 Tax=Pseudomonas nitroreducens TaxID=46680 RepID=A0A7W7P4P0_PSENT|nr:NUDIX hydrolase [Pseudomonas nitritireducens]MBB4866840.1 ADP-ribose pyrophosphatase [Pseudomonas nitritireducens]